jgi:hypothetical protein
LNFGGLMPKWRSIQDTQQQRWMGCRDASNTYMKAIVWLRTTERCGYPLHIDMYNACFNCFFYNIYYIYKV